MIVSDQLEASKWKKKLNTIVENGNWEMDDEFSDYSYCDQIDISVFRMHCIFSGWISEKK